MFKNINKKILFCLVFLQIFIITVSNFLVSIPLEIYGFKLTWSAFSFPLVVLAIDLTIRVLGKSIARATITLSYPLAIISSIVVLLIEGSTESVAFRIGFASATAYGVSTLLDVYLFQIIRERYNAWWIAPSISTIFANIIDTYVFFFSAFSNSSDQYMADNWLEISATQSIIKIIIGLLLFLPFYGVLLNFILKKFKK
ncbi:MAG: queuosine precursor transporter [Cytophagales bacterium]